MVKKSREMKTRPLKFVLSPRFDDLFGAEFVDFLLDAVKVPTPPVIIVAAIAHQKPIIPFRHCRICITILIAIIGRCFPRPITDTFIGCCKTGCLCGRESVETVRRWFSLQPSDLEAQENYADPNNVPR